MVDNAFCATGPGGGVDPSCGGESRADREEGTQAEADREVKKADKRVAQIKAKIASLEGQKPSREKLVKAISRQLAAARKPSPDALDKIKAAHEKRKAAIDARSEKRKQRLREKYKAATGKDLD